MNTLKAPAQFTGSSDQDPEDGLRRFELYEQAVGWDDSAFPTFLEDHGWEWYRNVPRDLNTDWGSLKLQMTGYFCSETKKMVDRIGTACARATSHESSQDIRWKCLRASQLNYNDRMTMTLVIQGLRPHLRAFVIERNPKSVEEVRHLCGQAELVQAPKN